MKNWYIVAIVILMGLFFGGCSSVQNSFERTALNWTSGNAKVECYSGGKLILSTTTIGKVTDDEDSDGFFFKDQDGTFKEVVGDCIFTYLKQ